MFAKRHTFEIDEPRLRQHIAVAKDAWLPYRVNARQFVHGFVQCVALRSEWQLLRTLIELIKLPQIKARKIRLTNIFAVKKLQKRIAIRTTGRPREIPELQLTGATLFK